MSMEPYSVNMANVYFRLLLQNRQPDSLQTCWGCTLGGCLLSLFTRWRCHHFLIFYEFLCSFFGEILKNLLRNRQANLFEITQEHSWGGLNLNLFTRGRCNFFQFFNEFLCVFAIFVFFSETAGWIIFKPGGDVAWVNVYQVCSLGGAAVIF